MKQERLRGIVLRRTNYGEADRIVQFITPMGRRAVMARGVRREKSKLAGGIELFAESDVVVGQGRGDLGVLTSARMHVFYSHILDDYDRMNFAYEAVKLVARGSENVDEPEWYDILREVLQALNDTRIDVLLIGAWLYLRVAAVQGHEVNLTYDVHGDKLTPEKRYMYDVAEQGLRPLEKGDIHAEHIKLLRLIATKDIHTLAQIGGVSDVLPGIHALARAHAGI